MRFRGWPLTGWITVGLVLMCALVLGAAGTGEEGIRMWIRATARSSALLFLAAFLARPARQLWRSGTTAFLLRNRRYVGVSMAVSHAIHAAGIVWLSVAHPSAYEADVVTLVGGGLAFAFLAAMAATSSDAAVARLGRARWQLLHRTGAWYVWLIFAFTFVPDPSHGWDALHAVAVVAFVAAPLLRAAAWAETRRRRPAAA
ncbi:MAG: ferric reductase-like transmembrane domain-containing protein [Myxococcota bacterium]